MTPDAHTVFQVRALDKKANKIEKLKNKKGGHNMWSEVHELGQLIRYPPLSHHEQPGCRQACSRSLQQLLQMLKDCLCIHSCCFCTYH